MVVLPGLSRDEARREGPGRQVFRRAAGEVQEVPGVSVAVRGGCRHQLESGAMIRWRYPDTPGADPGAAGLVRGVRRQPAVPLADRHVGHGCAGAKVELDAADVALWRADVRLRNLRVTDPDAPLQNLFEIAEATLRSGWRCPAAAEADHPRRPRERTAVRHAASEFGGRGPPAPAARRGRLAAARL